MPKLLPKYIPSEAKKLHYKKIYAWLQENKEIEFKKLYPFGFTINIASVPVNKVDEFISIVEFKEK
jgi:hypothetical protein